MLKKRSMSEKKGSWILYVAIILFILVLGYFGYRGITGNAVLQEQSSKAFYGSDILNSTNPNYNINFPSAVYLTGLRVNWSDFGNGCSARVQYRNTNGAWTDATSFVAVPDKFQATSKDMTGFWSINKESSAFKLKVDANCKKVTIRNSVIWYNYTTNSCFSYGYGAWIPDPCLYGTTQTRTVASKVFGSICSSPILSRACPTTCNPGICVGKCGTITNGNCGGTLNCGGCSAGQVCTNNICVGSCIPTTCVAQGKNCGTISNGCNDTLNCGSCITNQTCTNNICVAIPSISSAALVAKYSFDENSGSVLTDSSGKGNNGIISGAVWSSGHRGSSLSLDGNDDYVQIPLNGFLSEKGAISMWINPIAFGEHNYIFGETMSGWVNYLQLYFYKGTLNVGFSAQHTTNSLGNSVPLNKWSHVLLTWNKTNYSVYINKTLYSVGSNSLSGSLNSFADLGNNGESTYRLEAFNGAIDDVRIYNGSLTSAEILQIYNEEFVPACTTDSQCSDGLFCNGAEICSGGNCAAGSSVNCNDNNANTVDSCDESLDKCVNVASNSACPKSVNGLDYYVSSTNANRSDNNVGTDCRRPWASFDKIKSSWASIPAGSTIHLERGSEWTWTAVDGRGYFHIERGGNSSGVITIRGDDYGSSANSKPILRRANFAVATDALVIDVTKGGYVTIRDFIIDGGCTSSNSACTDSVGTSAISVSQNTYWGNQAGEIRNVTIKNVEVRNLGSSVGPGYYVGIGFYPRMDYNIYDCLIEGNDVSGYSSHAYNQYPNHYVNYGGRHGEMYNTIWRNNVAHDPSPKRFGGAASGMHYSTGGSGNIIENNTFIGPNPQGSLMIDVFTGTDQGVIIRNNIFRDNSLGTGIVIWGAENTATFNADIYNNIFYNNRYFGMSFQGVNNPIYGTVNIFNNVFFNNAYEANDWHAELGISGNNGFATLNIRNNIFSHSVGVDHSLRIANDFRGTVNHNNNLFWDSRGDRVSIQDYKNSKSYTLSNVKNFEPTAQNTNPNFVNVANVPSGFKVNSGSPAINSGASLGSSFDKAFDGAIRSGSWDIGAYEQ